MRTSIYGALFLLVQCTVCQQDEDSKTDVDNNLRRVSSTNKGKSTNLVRGSPQVVKTNAPTSYGTSSSTSTSTTDATTYNDDGGVTAASMQSAGSNSGSYGRGNSGSGFSSSSGDAAKKLKAPPANPVAGEYIIEVAPQYNPRDVATGLIRGVQQSSSSSGNSKAKPIQVGYYFDEVLNAFLVQNFNIPVGRMDAFLSNPQIVNVWQNGAVNATATQKPTPSWGLDRIDASPTSSTKLDDSYTYSYTGQGVDVYVLDTPVYPDPVEFGSRFASCYSVTSESCSVPATESHGTFIMGIIGGKTYGVAKLARLHSVRVLKNDGGGTFAGVIAGLDYVVKQKYANQAKKIVVNLSLGGGTSTALDNAVNNAVSKGLVVVVSAGNVGIDACKWSPASAKSAVTVGATDYRDNVVWYSNYGTCVDLYAPGDNIQSIDAKGRQMTDSGTSMAAPHVAGAAALYLEAGKGINDLLADVATGALKAVPAYSPNKIVYVGRIKSSCYKSGTTCSRHSQCCSKYCSYNSSKRYYICS